MRKKILLMGIITVVLLFVSTGNVFAKSLVANLGDVRIYSLGRGYFEVESDRLQMCIPLRFSQLRSGLIEIVCASKTREVVSSSIGWGVEQLVSSYITSQTGGGMKAAGEYAGTLAGTIASWASRQAIDYLCD